MSRSAQSGISLVEILVSIAIVGVLFALGMPAYTTWIQNTQIRTAAEAITNGLQTAKNEAIRQNATMQFKLVNGVDSQWAVNLSSNPDLDPPLFGRSAEEGSPNATLTLTPAGSDTVTFNALGRVIPNADGSLSLSMVVVNNLLIPVPADRHRLAILIPPGGSIRLCDAQAPATDPRTCLPTVIP